MTDKPKIIGYAFPVKSSLLLVNDVTEPERHRKLALIRLTDLEAFIDALETENKRLLSAGQALEADYSSLRREVEHKQNASAADKARIAELVRERDGLLKDKARLDYLDRMNESLNAHYGTTYKWRLVLSPNVTRLMTGRQDNGYVGDIDLHDSDALGKSSCREAIDAALAQQGKEGE